VTAPLIEVSGLSKKFCRSLKRSLWYGMKDLGAEVFGRSAGRGTLRTGEFWAIRDLSFELHRGETLGLIGPNGAGKTTLLRILNGLLKPDEGQVTVRGRMQALIALGAGFHPILTGRENVYVNASILGISKAEADRRLDSIVEFAGIPEFIDAPVQSYSSGMIVRLGFAVAAHLEPDILLVDEVLAVGDEGFQMKCLNKIGELKMGGTAIILVSHNMHTISTYSNRVLFKSPQGHELFTDVGSAVVAYRRLVHARMDGAIEKHCSGTASIEFFDVEIPETSIQLGGDIQVRLHYRSTVAYEDVEVDLALRLAGDVGWHFQVTNVALGRRIDLLRGEGWLDLRVRNLRAINVQGRLSVTVWRHGRTEVLFWWRIPVRFATTLASSGANVYDVSYETGSSRRERGTVAVEAQAAEHS
jgi:ABC-type polysaccharide/polyol phosphate transport system ATPase subunit